MMKHGATVDMTHINLFGDGGLYVDDNTFHFGGIMKSSTIIYRNLLKRILKS